MLEESLNNPNGSPSETSRALLSFFRQEFPLGGTAAEARFVHFFPTLLERVFGPVIANSLSRDYEFTSEELKLIGSAWLMLSRPWSFASSTSGTTASTATSLSYPSYGTGASSAPKLDSDPVVQILTSPQNAARKSSPATLSESSSARALSFFEVLTCQSDLELNIVRNAQSSFPFTELPRDWQLALIHLVELPAGPGMPPTSPLSGTPPNSTLKLMNCLCTNPLQQKEFLHLMRQIASQYAFGFDRGTSIGFQQRSLQGGPGILSPTMASGSGMGLNPPNSPSSVQDVSTMKQDLILNLSLCEYYLISFCRFPLVLGKMNQVNKKSSTSGTNRSRQSGLPFGEKVYFHLLRDYIKYFFPHEYDEASDRVHIASTHLSVAKTKTKEFFVRAMVGYWLEKHAYTNTKDAMANSSLDEAGLESCYDLAQLLPVADMWNLSNNVGGQTRQTYEAPPKQAQRSIKILVEHLVCDPAIINYCRRDLGKQVGSGVGSEADTNYWPISPQQSIIQPSLYNYIRTGLRYGPIHVSRSSFYASMDLWLMWLEPWNVQRKLFGTSKNFEQFQTNLTYLFSILHRQEGARCCHHAGKGTVP